jgi:hypothetical protein
MSDNLPSPFTVPSLEDGGLYFVQEFRDLTPPPPPENYTLGNLVGNLRQFGTSYRQDAELIQRQPSIVQRHGWAQLGAFVTDAKESLSRILGFNELRTFALAAWGEEMSLSVCGRIVGELIKRSNGTLSAADAEMLTLGEAASRLRRSERVVPGGRTMSTEFLHAIQKLVLVIRQNLNVVGGPYVQSETIPPPWGEWTVLGWRSVAFSRLLDEPLEFASFDLKGAGPRIARVAQQLRMVNQHLNDLGPEAEPVQRWLRELLEAPVYFISQDGQNIEPFPVDPALLGHLESAAKKLLESNDKGREGQGGSSKKGRSGRRPDTDPREDKRLADAWGTGQYQTYDQCGQALGTTGQEVKKAVDRHRHRPSNKRSKHPQAPE